MSAGLGGHSSHRVGADVVFDVTGYFSADASGALYVPLNPARILDSRSDTGFSGPLATSVAQTFAVTGQGSVPSAATAVTGNLTVTEQDAPATSNRPGGYGCPDQLYAQLPAQR